MTSRENHLYKQYKFNTLVSIQKDAERFIR